MLQRGEMALRIWMRSYCMKTTVKTHVKDVFLGKRSGAKVVVQGWTQSIRKHKHQTFVDVNDGSSVRSLQLVLDPKHFDGGIQYGSSVLASGLIVETSKNKNKYEMICENLSLIGLCDAEAIPIVHHANHDMQHLRSYLHLRMREYKMACVLRIRNRLEREIHNYYQERGFLHVHTPILTSSDCEGAGEVFSVASNISLNEDEDNNEFVESNLKRPEMVDPDDDTELPKSVLKVPAYLTVSAQLHLEACAMGMGNVYTLSPTFRAERSTTRRHLSEFRMLEVEIAYSKTIDDIMELMEDNIKVLMKRAHQFCADDLGQLLNESSEHLQIVEKAMNASYVRMSYTEAVELLRENSTLLKTPAPSWGNNLNAEHESFLTTHCDSTPVFVTDFPSETRPFYMLTNSDEKTAAAVDLLFPHCGELCGGSVREYRLDVLQSKLESLDMAEKYNWYLDLRRYGNTPHAGYGMGFDRLVMFLLGLQNIRDAVPFPRAPHSCVL